MLRFYNTALALQEVPDEISLAVNFMGCPYHCKGCHSPHLWNAEGGQPVAELWPIINRYRNNITCICLMGGDWDMASLDVVTGILSDIYPELKIALYGANELEHYSDNIHGERILKRLSYLKTGMYIESFGGLDSADTNQRFWKMINGNPEPVPLKIFRKGVGLNA